MKFNFVTNESLMVNAFEFHLSLDTEVVFSVSPGWMEKFKKRQCLPISINVTIYNIHTIFVTFLKKCNQPSDTYRDVCRNYCCYFRELIIN